MVEHCFDHLGWCTRCGSSRDQVATTKMACTGKPGRISALYLDSRRRSQVAEQILDEYAKQAAPQ